MKFSIKDLVTFTGEILNKKFHFLRSDFLPSINTTNLSSGVLCICVCRICKLHINDISMISKVIVKRDICN